MRKLRNALAFSLAMGLTAPIAAQEDSVSPADDAAIDALIEPVLKSLESPSSRSAVITFLNTNKSGAIGQVDMNSVVSNIDNSLSIFGRVTRCALNDEKAASELVVRRIYLCQHEKGITRWKISVVKVPTGWSAFSLSFDTDIDELF